MVNFVCCFTTDHLNHDLIVTQILMNPPFIVHESGGGEMAALAEKLLSLNILEPCEPIRGFFTCKKSADSHSSPVTIVCKPPQVHW